MRAADLITKRYLVPTADDVHEYEYAQQCCRRVVDRLEGLRLLLKWKGKADEYLVTAVRYCSQEVACSDSSKRKAGEYIPLASNA